MERVLAPRRPEAPGGKDAWETGLAHIARVLGGAIGEGPAASPRVDLFRALPADCMAWLLSTFPTYFQNARGFAVPLAPHHEEYWRWLWSLRPGEAARTFIAIWGRGGGKSTSLELGAACLLYFGLRRYVIYVCGTQAQADDHVANVATLLEGLGVERAMNRYGFSRGWNINRLRTAEGGTLDAIGLDKAARGIRIEEWRPDGVFLDELDEQLDTRLTTAKKIDVLTRAILPTVAERPAVAGVQNLPNTDGVFAQLADGRAEFLLDRYVSGPHPALADLPMQDWYETVPDPETGQKRLRLTAGRPVWAGQGLDACERLLNLMGPRAFLIECQHRGAVLEGDLFQRGWFPIVADWPRQAQSVRYWDFAATEATPGSDPDWTVGLAVACWQGRFWVVDMRRVRASPKGVEDLVRQTARLDGRSRAIWLEEEGGASGKAVSAHYRQAVLAGYSVHTWHATGSKFERSRPVSSAAEAGNVALVAGPWNTAFLDEVSQFGLTGVHDDIVDALSGAHFALTQGQTYLPSDFSLAKALEGQTQAGFHARAQAGTTTLPLLGARWGVEDVEEAIYG